MTIKPKPAATFKVGDKVKFATGHAKGTGEIAAVRATLRGDQDELKVENGKTRCVRLAHLSAAK